MQNFNQIISHQNDLSFSLLNGLLINNNSVILSPISLSIALSMCLVGSRNETENEFKQFLYNNNNNVNIHEYFQQIIQNQQQKNPNYILDLVNRVYFNEEIEIKNDFKQFIQTYYAGQLEPINVDQNIATAKVLYLLN